LEPNPEERLFQPRKIARTKPGASILMQAFILESSLQGPLAATKPDECPIAAIRAISNLPVNVFSRPVQFGDQTDNKLQILGVIRNNFRGAVKLALGRLGNFAIRQRSETIRSDRATITIS
jgi:hypothetical protein